MRLPLALATIAAIGTFTLSEARSDDWNSHYAVDAKVSGGEVVVTIEGKPDWYVNTEYNLKVNLAAPDGVTLGKTALTKADARLEGTEVEGKAKKAVFSTKTSSSSAVSGDYKIVICSKSSCSPPLKGTFTTR